MSPTNWLMMSGGVRWCLQVFMQRTIPSQRIQIVVPLYASVDSTLQH